MITLKIINKMLNKIFIVFLFLIYLTSFSYAKSLKEFKISGNDRISNETIILFSGYKIDDQIDENSLNIIPATSDKYASSLINNKSVTFPYLSLIVSGGHTQIWLVENFNRYKVVANTVDDVYTNFSFLMSRSNIT